MSCSNATDPEHYCSIECESIDDIIREDDEEEGVEPL